jgi:N-acetylneuraminic acid mutarotase
MGQQLVALKDGRILFAGGEDASYSPTNLASIFNPATKTWTAAAPMHEARVTFAAVLLADGKVLVEGGEVGSQLLSSAELYDPDNNTWTRIASIPMPRRGETTTLLKDGNVLFAGGEDKGYNPLGGAEIYQTRTGTWKTIQAPAFVEHTATLLPDGRVLVVCGTEPEYYDPVKNTWTPATAPLEGMNGQFAVLLPSGKLLVGGGIDYASSRQLASAEIFNPTTQTWSAAGTMRSPSYGARAVVLKDGRVLVTGGADAKGVALQSAELYDPGSGRWTDAGSMPTPRESYEEFALSDGTALIGGGVARNGLANDAVLFSPSN